MKNQESKHTIVINLGIFIVLITIFFTFSHISYAAVDPIGGGGGGGGGIGGGGGGPPVGGAPGPFGIITNPLSQGSLGPQGGLITLLNNVLRLVFVGAGIYSFFQIIGAGLGFMSAGADAKKIEQAWGTIWQSLLGVIIVISSIAIASLIGLLLFGDPTAILSPKIYGPTL